MRLRRAFHGANRHAQGASASHGLARHARRASIEAHSGAPHLVARDSSTTIVTQVVTLTPASLDPTASVVWVTVDPSQTTVSPAPSVSTTIAVESPVQSDSTPSFLPTIVTPAMTDNDVQSTATLPPSLLPGPALSLPMSLAITSVTLDSSLPTLIASSSAATPSSADSTSGPSELTVAAKAGIVIGVALAVLAVVMIAYLFLDRRKRSSSQIGRRASDEKPGGIYASKPLPQPQVSLVNHSPSPRSPTFVGNKHDDGAIPLSPPSRGDHWNRPATSLSTLSSDTTNNPFSDRNAVLSKTLPSIHVTNIAAATATAASRSLTPEPSYNVGIATTTDSPHPPPRSASPPTTRPRLARSTSMRQIRQSSDNHAQSPSNHPPIPTNPGGPENTVSSSNTQPALIPSLLPESLAKLRIHRVQTNFKPNLDDELLACAGDLVRLVHEYDDGWSMCIRFDGSAKGVLPHSCLSKQPIKLRPLPSAGPAHQESSGAI